MRLLFSFCIVLLFTEASLSQPDTLWLKLEVDGLTDQHSIQKYLDHIFQEDQHFRGDMTNMSIDIEHLISLSYFINNHSYPTEEEYGQSANSLRMVWIHVPFHNMKRLSFPIIHKAFIAGLISENSLRTYYLQRLYEDRFDDDKNLSLPLDSVFAFLELNTTNTIPTHQLFLAAKEIKTLRSLPKKESWKWNGAVKTKMVTANGERVLMTSKDAPVEIFILESCKIYFRKLFSDNSYEPKELIKIGDGKYKFKNKVTNKYFEIKADGDLVYTNGEQVIYEYKKSQ